MSHFQPSDQKIDTSNIIDAKGLKSPIPLLRLKKKLAVAKKGDIVQIDCTDPISHDDISNWCDRMKHSFLGEKDGPDCSIYYIEKK